MGAALRGVHIMGEHLVGGHLMGVHLTSVHLLGVYLMSVSRECIFCGRASAYPKPMFSTFAQEPPFPAPVLTSGPRHSKCTLSVPGYYAV